MANSRQQKRAAERARKKKEARVKTPSTTPQAKSQELAYKNGQLQTALLNMRHMYDQSVMERQSVTTSLEQLNKLITGMLVDGDITVTAEEQQEVEDGLWIGFEVLPVEDGNITLRAVPTEEVEDGEETDE